MVAHKYSYGIPEARKTSIPADAHMCPFPPPLLIPLVHVRSAIPRPANGREKRRNYEFSAVILRGVVLRENRNFLSRAFTTRNFLFRYFPRLAGEKAQFTGNEGARQKEYSYRKTNIIISVTFATIANEFQCNMYRRDHNYSIRDNVTSVGFTLKRRKNSRYVTE